MKNLSSESHFEHKAFTTRNNKFFFDALTIQRQQSKLVAILLSQRFPVKRILQGKRLFAKV
jgi:hypothetical protein